MNGFNLDRNFALWYTSPLNVLFVLPILSGFPMQYLWRALKSTFEYKFTIFVSLICAVALALCWGGNITAVYPLVQISFQGETIPQWLAKKIAEKEDDIRSVQAQLAELEKKRSALPAMESPSKALGKEKLRLDVKRAKYQQELDWLAYVKPYIERYTPTDPFLTIVWLMLFVIVGTLAKCVFTFLHGYYSTKIGQLGSLKIREEFFRKMLAYEVNHFSNRGVSDAMSRFTGDMSALSGGISLFYGKLVREPFKMIVCVAGAIYISWQLFLFTTLFLPLVAALIMWMAKSLKRVVTRSMEEMARLYGRIEETFRLIRVVKAFNQEQDEAKRFHDTNMACFRRGMKIAKYGSLVSPVTECLGTVMMIVAVLVGAYLVTHEKTTIFGVPMASEPLDLGTLILFYGFLLGAADPARRLSDFFLNIQSAVAAADRIYVMIDRELPLVEPEHPKPLAPFHDKLEFDHVSFFYDQYSDVASGAGEVLKNLPEDPTRIVLQDVNLSIRFGETVAIVGPSGCGKSTLLNLIPRFCDPSSGKVLLDSIPLPEVSSYDLRSQIGLVTQETTLFNDTVFENIRYGVPEATMEMVVQAAKRAYAHDFIVNSLSDGYHTRVGHSGGQLSGGQRQRIALARVFLKNPRILLLDEATSQIDILSEQYIHEALSEFVGNRATIIVTHRLTAIRLADRIIAMNNGRVEGVGTHDELLKLSPFYAGLWETETGE